jgi:pyridoxal phosphate enzyme (YggS family)
MDHSYIDKNLSRIREQLECACLNTGRDVSDVSIVAAVKSADASEIDHLHLQLGICDVGENRVQQLLEHYGQINREGLRIHFIGTLQTNKVKYIADKVYMIQSLDSMKLALEIDKRCKNIGKIMNVLIEINSGEEENKSGISPAEAEKFALELQTLENIRLCGFMTMAPRCESDEKYRLYFSNTRQLCDGIWRNTLGRKDKMIMSMGMSDSFVPAVMEGATVIRPGRSLFCKE